MTRRDSDLEAFSHNPTVVASRHWSVDQAHEPYDRTCGSSRTKQDFYREDYELLCFKRIMSFDWQGILLVSKQKLHSSSVG